MSAAPALSPSPGRDYAKHVNPQWVRLLELLRMNVRYTRCAGTELFTDDGRRILDCLSGYCVHNTGHNHPLVASQGQLEECVAAVRAVVDLAHTSASFWSEALGMARRAVNII
jgi:4-aminobutyrate aminotransferase-like enzyme